MIWHGRRWCSCPTPVPTTFQRHHRYVGGRPLLRVSAQRYASGWASETATAIRSPLARSHARRPGALE
jgi:hypothetical protein